jgi:anaerobic ribonucleoside-triphosphate reductase activating protein
MTPLPARHRPDPGRELRVARVEEFTEVLGPGARSVAWLQGCELRCRGCVVPESHPRGGDTVAPEILAQALLAHPEVHGTTFSGGEPFLQSRGLVEVARLLRTSRPDWTLMSYTGYRLETLVRRGAPSQRALLAELDILVDGPFLEGRAAMLRWRGSSNQRLLALSERGAAALAGLDDSWAGLEITVGSDGGLAWTGVPPLHFRDALDQALLDAGLVSDHNERSPR